MHSILLKWEVVNIVIHAKTRPVNMQKLTTKLLNHGIDYEYNPSKINAVRIKIKPKVTALVFPAGSIILTGAKSTDEAIECTNSLCNFLEDCLAD